MVDLRFVIFILVQNSFDQEVSVIHFIYLFSGSPFNLSFVVNLVVTGIERRRKVQIRLLLCNITYTQHLTLNTGEVLSI